VQVGCVMAKKKSKINASAVEPKFKEPLKFEDFLKPSPLIRPWMLPYLPDDLRSREAIFVLVGAALWVLVFEALLLVKFPEWFCVPTLLLGIAFLGGDFHTRFMIAGMKFERAKRMIRGENTSFDKMEIGGDKNGKS
jgi:hypothetical protein